MNPDRLKAPALRDLVRAMRPNQWTKNAVVFAAFFFAYGDRMRAQPLAADDLLLRVIPAAALFCLVSSGMYLINDVADVESDRHHPVKRLRPIAAGLVSVPWAWAAALVCLAAGMLGASLLSPSLAVVIGVYLAMQLAYTAWLKHVALVDIVVIASGFVLRAIAGAVVLSDVDISPWLLLCAFLLALFLALCKRRHEKMLPSADVTLHRRSLEGYDPKLLDQLIAITAASTIVCYSIYTLWPQTVAKFGTAGLGFTIPFVIMGVFRYLFLVYRHERGGRPERILLTDLPLLVNLACYGATVAAVFALR